jgi:NADH-quinone oxidoreductase subunit I
MIDALKLAWSNLFKEPNTKKYPFEKTYTPPNIRGLIGYNEEKCIFCLKCENVCPPRAIVFDTELEEGKQTYHYNPYLCIYCQECVRACPEPGKDGALWQEEDVCPPALKAENPNQKWRQLQIEAEKNRSEWKKIKAQKKKAQKEVEDDN